MAEQITKMSQTVGRDAVYTKTVSIVQIIKIKLDYFQSYFYPVSRHSILVSRISDI